MRVGAPVIPVAVGDSVVAELDPSDRIRVVGGLVDDVITRYGHIDGTLRTRRQYPFVILDDETVFDLACVVGIIRQSVKITPAPFNWYKNMLFRDRVFTGKKGVWFGLPVDLVEACLAEMVRFVPTPVDPDRCDELFYKDRPGVIDKVHPDFPGKAYVKLAPFKRWVSRNVTRLCFTAKETDAKADALRDEDLKAGLGDPDDGGPSGVELDRLQEEMESGVDREPDWGELGMAAWLDPDEREFSEYSFPTPGSPDGRYEGPGHASFPGYE